jgi:pimeloyl-ACP methyl ester carboxylesterase
MSFRERLEGARSIDEVIEIMERVSEASLGHRAFASARELKVPSERVTLCDGEIGLPLVCLPPFMPGSGAFQFTELAKAFASRRTLTVVPNPGFAAGEDPPASLPALSEALTEIVCAAVAGEPFVLVGYSGGGVIAHVVASHLERLGAPLRGLIVLDTFVAADPDTGRLIASVIADLARRPSSRLMLSERQLIATGAYIRLFRDWAPGPLLTPSLMLHASRALPGITDGDRSAGYAMAAVHADVPGDHFSLLEADAATTAQSMEQWIRGLELEPAGAHARG